MKEPNVPTDIRPFKDITKVDHHNIPGFLYLNYLISGWSGKCVNTPPVMKNFDIIKGFTAIDIPSYILPTDRYINIACMYHSKKHDMIVISFSGSMYYTQLLEDFDFAQVTPSLITTDKDIRIHMFHYIIYETIRADIMNCIAKLKKENTVIVCTGHSLGGSLSAICFFDIAYNNIVNNRVLYTFGAPRTGNVKFAEIMNAEPATFRIANSEDLITTLPPAISILNNLFQTPPVIYDHYNGHNISFSMNLGKIGPNHIDSYADQYLYNKDNVDKKCKKSNNKIYIVIFFILLLLLLLFLMRRKCKSVKKITNVYYENY